jgi:hypothetical protein
MSGESKPRKPAVIPDRAADAAAVQSPWLNLWQAAAYLFRGRRFVRKIISAGQLRAAVVGQKREILTRRDWCDQYVENQATPIMLPSRRRVG